MQITFTANAYKANWHNIDDIRSGEQKPYVWAHECDEYTLIGTAEVTVNLFDSADINKAQLQTLNKKLQEVRADNQQRENAILLQISKLQALTYEVAA